MSSSNDFRVKNVASWKYGAEQVPALYVFETLQGDTIFTSLYAINPETGARTVLLGRDTLLHTIRLTEPEKTLLTRFIKIYPKGSLRWRGRKRWRRNFKSQSRCHTCRLTCIIPL